MPEKNNKTSIDVHPSQLKRFKQEAKKYKKHTGCTHAQALDHVVRERGFSGWRAVVAKAEKLGTPQGQVVARGSETADSTIPFDFEGAGQYGPRVELGTDAVRVRVAANRAILVKHGIDHSVFEPTVTGLKKSILDSTQAVRTHFLIENFHDFSSQLQGPENKVVKGAFLVAPNKLIKSLVSLYRPNTKKGDPRMWFRRLGEFARAGDQLAIAIVNDEAYLLNLSACNFDMCIGYRNNIGEFILNFRRSVSDVASELLGTLRELAKKPLQAIGHGDTTVGMTVEAALGIAANSSRLPDYKGIELKVGRTSKNRSTLFAQVAEWRRSACKSSAEILDKYGYFRGEDFKLYCTVSASKANSQGLLFIYNEESDDLVEVHETGDQVAVWSGDLLRRRLIEKHAETFWIHAESEIVDGVERFHLTSITHTKAPLSGQLMSLIASGVITMDHLIKRKSGPVARVSEKGPLFKIDKKNLGLLFPPPEVYSLLDRSGE